jgi:hypothetical protein
LQHDDGGSTPTEKVYLSGPIVRVPKFPTLGELITGLRKIETGGSLITGGVTTTSDPT